MLEEVRAFLAAPSPDRFPELALRVFRFQWERNAAYRRFCDRRGVRPESIDDWRRIPAVPVAAFKHADLSVGDLPGGRTFRTSGTTEGAALRGRHRVPDPEIYRAAALPHFGRMVLPDDARPRFVVLAPTLSEEPESSLCQMIDWLAAAYATGAAEHFVSGGELDARGLAERLRALESGREPVLLVGVTYAFVRFFDFCAAERLAFRLPYGSRVVDTGGTKGRARSMSRNGLIRAFWELFGIAGYWVANEYGMTEMCSQFYDGSIRDHFEGRKRDRAKIAPPWVRTEILSAERLEPVPPGERGLLRHFDLANVGSVIALQTEDVGVAVGEGFEIAGRARGAEARGCAMLLADVTS